MNRVCSNQTANCYDFADSVLAVISRTVSIFQPLM